MTRDSSRAPLAEEVALQGSVMLEGMEGGGAAGEVQVPALAAVVPGALQHLQVTQPGTTSAEAAQQQPWHMLVPQSMLEPQTSPG